MLDPCISPRRRPVSLATPRHYLAFILLRRYGKDRAYLRRCDESIRVHWRTRPSLLISICLAAVSPRRLLLAGHDTAFTARPSAVDASPVVALQPACTFGFFDALYPPAHNRAIAAFARHQRRGSRGRRAYDGRCRHSRGDSRDQALRRLYNYRLGAGCGARTAAAEGAPAAKRQHRHAQGRWQQHGVSRAWQGQVAEEDCRGLRCGSGLDCRYACGSGHWAQRCVSEHHYRVAQ